jgi:hypothetical protein
MRILLACALIALLSVSAYAQGASGGKKRGRHAQTTEQPKKVDDRAYKSALKGIPDAKPADPWGSVRSGAH